MRKSHVSCVAALFAALSLLFAAAASAAEGEVQWLGHSTVRITSVEGKVIDIDPFLKTNPTVPPRYRDLKALGDAPIEVLDVKPGQVVKF